MATAPRPRVLLVDDAEANLIVLEAQLDRPGYELVRARSGNQALRLLLDGEFAVILLDVELQDMDAHEVARFARGHPTTRDVPIIFVTARQETDLDARRGHGAGAVDVLFKPVDAAILRSKVDVFVELYLARRRLADEVRAHERTLANLEAFNYSISHDLRAPLRPLDGFSQILLEDYADVLDDKGKGYLHRIQKAARRMTQLIDDLLALSRTGEAPMAVQPVDLVPIAAAVVAELRETEPARAVDFVSVPEAPVSGDPRLLRIVLENLLRNAWKFTRDVAGTARIELGTTHDAGPDVYFVRDDGAGFSSVSAPRLFQPFQRFHAQADFEGTGIGLAIVRRIIDRHGGRIWAESTRGQGATFFFTVGPDAARILKARAPTPA